MKGEAKEIRKSLENKHGGGEKSGEPCSFPNQGPRQATDGKLGREVLAHRTKNKNRN